MNWNQKNYTEIIAKHSVLENKPESVALAVWALEHNRDMSPQDWRDLSKSTGVKVAGRAVGSAREILGLRSGKPTRKKAGIKRGPGGSGGSENRGRASLDAGDAIENLIATLARLQRERDQAVDALERVRTLVNSF